MKQNKLIDAVAIIVLLIIWNTCTIYGQSAYDPSYSAKASKIFEKLQVITDRSMYITGESIQFRAESQVTGNKGEKWSTVVYAELIDATGRSIAQIKAPIQDSKCSSYLSIPETALTGNYYLKCYTRWMRNFGPDTYSYSPIVIVNPNKKEVVEGSHRDENQDNRYQQLYIKGILSCLLSKDTMKRGEEISLTLLNRFGNDYDSLNCTVTVVPQNSIDLERGELKSNAGDVDASGFKVSVLPDLGRGPLLSGTLTTKDGKPAPYIQLFFSAFGNTPDFLPTHSDFDGRFEILTPVGYGPKEMFVSPQQKQAISIQTKIDSEFDSSPLRLPKSKFSLSEEETKLASHLSLLHQFSKTYVQADPKDEEITNQTLSFYGSSFDRTNLDNYVTLPSLKEVFSNLVAKVVVSHKNDKYSIRVLSTNPDVRSFQPLILIDNINFTDHQEIISLPSKKIQYIDVIDEVYLKGGQFFGGVISISSRNGDFAGIDLPSSSYFFDYIYFQPPRDSISTPFADSINHIPDSRNTILWLEDVILKNPNSREISFKAPEFKGNYVVLVRAVAPDGGIMAASTRFVVE